MKTNIIRAFRCRFGLLLSGALACAFSATAAPLKLSHQLFTPSIPLKPTEKLPMVVMLHGCDETGVDFAKVTGMNDLGERFHFFVLYPEQDRKRNAAGCWNWFQSANQKKDGPETVAIVALIQSVLKSHPVRKNAVFVAGLSAGGAMAGILINCFPELFRAAAIHSSASYVRARDFEEGVRLMAHGPSSSSPHERQCQPSSVPLLIIHGGEDKVVNPTNASALLSDLSSDTSGHSAKLIIQGIGHEWSGGTANMKYSNPHSLSASDLIWNFFEEMQSPSS